MTLSKHWVIVLLGGLILNSSLSQCYENSYPTRQDLIAIGLIVATNITIIQLYHYCKPKVATLWRSFKSWLTPSFETQLNDPKLFCNQTSLKQPTIEKLEQDLIILLNIRRQLQIKRDGNPFANGNKPNKSKAILDLIALATEKICITNRRKFELEPIADQPSPDIEIPGTELARIVYSTPPLQPDGTDTKNINDMLFTLKHLPHSTDSSMSMSIETYNALLQLFTKSNHNFNKTACQECLALLKNLLMHPGQGAIIAAVDLKKIINTLFVEAETDLT